ncbi:MAG TPA: phenylalanine--tRNA ligase subunit alpha [Acidimicrobiales bacterium]|nr:phenylalanine--tRNA ligase subunit alpha [Acidimicrobiales bacterium]
MIDAISRIVDDGVARVGEVDDLDALAEVDRVLNGKQSELGGIKAKMRDLDADARKEVGRVLNEAQQRIRAAIGERRGTLQAAARRERLEAERIDLTELRPTHRQGHLHLVTQTMERLEDVFVGLGFTVAEGPEVEDDWHNFTALNLPAHHPARDMQDTFFVDLGDPGDVVMRTHTSPVQIRLMESTKPPIYSVMPGRVYRQETADATHLAVFHQIECLVVDEGISFANLSATIDAFTKAYFGEGFSSRLRPSYFPFTEPSAEFDIRRPDGSWLELGGCGMVNPNVLSNVGLDPEVYSGFAFGFGLDRLAAMRHGVSDLREIASVDIRFVRQF